eukprot:scaffold108444_cov27-Tisochrysis_lutea.AAC.1
MMCESGTASSMRKPCASIRSGTLSPPPPIPEAPARTPAPKNSRAIERSERDAPAAGRAQWVTTGTGESVKSVTSRLDDPAERPRRAQQQRSYHRPQADSHRATDGEPPERRQAPKIYYYYY